MGVPPRHPVRLSRRGFLAASLAGCAAPGLADAHQGHGEAFAELDEKILQGMRDFSIPGVAVGVIHRGREYLRGYGVTDLGDPRPVDADTVFRIASTSKTFTGTAAMRLVDAGLLSLEERVDRYLPDFRPPPGAGPVTVRQLLNHSAGWLGYDYHDTGQGRQALARYVRDIRDLPQLTPVGEVMSYNNASISAAGRVIEAITGESFEAAVRRLVLRPLGLTRSGFTRQALGGADFAVPHGPGEDGKTVPAPEDFYLPRSCRPFGGVLSSITDQLAYARFHLGDGRAPGGERLMRADSLRAMRSDPGPGGTLIVELDGYGVSWMLRPTAEGPVVVQHGGDLPGYHSGFMMVPDRHFALTLLTNSDSGKQLVGELFYKDWALRRFAGVGNLPAEPRPLGAAELAAYEGSYTTRQIGFSGPPVDSILRMAGAEGALQMIQDTGDGTPATTVLRFYREDFVLVGDTGLRADFLRDAAGRVAWFRLGGRLFRREG